MTKYVCCAGCGRETPCVSSYPEQYCVFCRQPGRTRQSETRDRSDLKDTLDELPGFELEIDYLLEEEDEGS